MRVCVGGTFDRLHAGHRALLDRAFDSDSEVFIGLTSDRFARSKSGVAPYSERKKQLRRYLRRHGYQGYHIFPIDRKFGIADSADLDAIAVSDETAGTAIRINRARKGRGLQPLEIMVVEKVYGDDLIPVSSTRIRHGDIDCNGRRLRPVVIRVGSDNINKVRATKSVFSRAYLRKDIKISVKGVRVSSGVSKEPLGNETQVGAVNRARSAIGNADFGVGIEAGIFREPYTGYLLDVQYCAIIDRTGRITIGHGSGFTHPEKIMQHVKNGKSVGEAYCSAFGIKGIGKRQGAIGFLTAGALTRKELTEQAVLMAIVPRLYGRIQLASII